ncbi:MAG: hypothetical protein LBT86_06180 [Deltaproteobacteria bacterium]|jgi:malate dehydrogenase (oxaloacetate-decarboxylating)|nr:hypothetical protein [Deltaproteobacteria bacterium]
MTTQTRLELAQLLAEDPRKALELTGKSRTVALISNGGQIPELGPTTPQAALPYLEDQALLIQKLTNLRAWPLAINAATPEDLATFVTLLAPSCGVLCLDSLGDETYQAAERILTPLGLPVFFHPQQSRPILALAALLQGLALTNRELSKARIVLAGFEADSLAMVDYLLAAGATDLMICDRSGLIHKGRSGPTSWLKEQLAQKTNPQQIRGGLNKALSGADAYISRATPMSLTKDVVNMMAHRPIILNFSQALLPPGPFTTANLPLGLGVGPGPATRLTSHLLTPLVLSGLFAGVLKARVSSITSSMKLAVTKALNELIDQTDAGQFLPPTSHPRLVESVANRVVEATQNP